MASPIDVAKVLVEFSDYVYADKRKEAFVEHVGRVWRFKDAKNFLEDNEIIGFRDWSKQEQNLFVHLIKNSNHKDLIVEEYNRSVSQHEVMANKNKAFKMLASISELLKAPAYSKGDFSSIVMRKCVEWSFDDDSVNLNLLKKSLSLYADTKKIRDFVGEDSERKKDAFALLKGVELAEQSKEMNSSTLVSIAAMVSLGVPGVYSVMSKAVVSGIEKFGNWVATTGDLGVKVAEVVTKPNAVMFIVGAAAVYTFYKTFQELHKLSKKILENQKEKYVAGVGLENLHNLKSNSVLGQRILGKVIRNNKIDVRREDDRDYVALCCFAVEKLNNPNLKVSPLIVKELNLNKNQVEKLNSLKESDIHEISLINNPLVRRTMLLEKMSSSQKNILQTISLIEDIDAERYEKMKNYFRPFSEIRNLPTRLIDEIQKKSVVDQRIIQAYLNSYTNESGNCLSSVLRVVDNALKIDRPIASILKAEMEIEYFNATPKLPRNEELAYFKRIWKWLAEDKGRASELANIETKKVVEQTSIKYDFPFAERVNDLNPTVKEIIVRLGVSMKDSVVERISKIRDQISPTLTSNSNNSII